MPATHAADIARRSARPPRGPRLRATPRWSAGRRDGNSLMVRARFPRQADLERRDLRQGEAQLPRTGPWPSGPTCACVNLDNGSSVVVRVNDRGPFAKNRVIDLSEAAARIIGMIPTGTARVSPDRRSRGGGPRLEGRRPSGDADRAVRPTDASRDGRPAATRSRPRRAYASRWPPTRARANANSTVARLAASGLAAAIEDSGGHLPRRLPRPLARGGTPRLPEARRHGLQRL